jgi:hypothetical protein
MRQARQHRVHLRMRSGSVPHLHPGGARRMTEDLMNLVTILVVIVVALFLVTHGLAPWH